MESVRKIIGISSSILSLIFAGVSSATPVDPSSESIFVLLNSVGGGQALAS